MNPIIGKKVVLFEIQKADVPHFAEIHRQDKHGYMQAMNLSKMTQEESEKYAWMLLSSLQMVAFVVMTKEGKATRRAGYIYVTDLSVHGCSLSGIMVKEFAAGLARQVRRKKYTYSEDAIRTIIDWLYTNFTKLDRIQAEIVAENKLALALISSVGFKKEGTLRNYLHLDDKAVDVVVHSLLRSEWSNNDGLIKETTDNIDSRVPEAAVA